MKILIVDDSKFSQIITSRFMKSNFSEAEIFIANDGQEGFQKYKEIGPDYAFVDLLMPIVNGQELVKLIKEYNENAKIFVVSADVQKSVKEELEAYGILAFINKPFDEEKAKMATEIIKGDIDEGK